MQISCLTDCHRTRSRQCEHFSDSVSAHRVCESSARRSLAKRTNKVRLQRSQRLHRYPGPDCISGVCLAFLNCIGRYCQLEQMLPDYGNSLEEVGALTKDHGELCLPNQAVYLRVQSFYSVRSGVTIQNTPPSHFHIIIHKQEVDCHF